MSAVATKKRYFIRRSAAECGGEHGKPGPCPEHLTEDGAAHGVGGKTPTHVKSSRERLNAKGNGKITLYQHQAITDLRTLAGQNASVITPRFGNRKEHGGNATGEVTVTLHKDDPGFKKVVAYAHTHGMEVQITQPDKDGNRQVRVHMPLKERSQDEKETMRLYNSAQAGEGAALSGLVDKLMERDHPLGAQMQAEMAKGPDGETRALRLAEAHVIANGSLAAMPRSPKAAGEQAEQRLKRRWRCTEVAEDSTPQVRVDREKGEIYDVLVLGLKARNKRRYTLEAREDAIKRNVYEGLAVYIGPHKRHRFAKRSPNDHAGKLEGVYKAANGEIRARKLLVNRATRGGQIAMEIADKFPDQFGLSHHALIDGYEEDGEKIVTCIAEATVADLVKDPGTTDGIFEETDMGQETETETVVEDIDTATDTTGVTATAGNAMSWSDALKALIAAVHDDDSLEDDVKLKATKDLMKVKGYLSGDGEDEDEEEEGESAANETDETTAAGAEEVDVTKLMKRLKALEQAEADRKKAAKKRPKSSARSETTEDVTPKPKPKPALPNDRTSILAAYETGD